MAVRDEPVLAFRLGPADHRVTLTFVVHKRYAEAAGSLDPCDLGHDHLTDAGQVKLQAILPLWEQAQAKLIAEGLGPTRWGKLYDTLQEVVRVVQT